MRPFSFEHGKVAYRLDFVLYATAIVLLAAILVTAGPAGERVRLAALVAGGVLAWTLLEYVLHRFVLHGVAPFRDWHAEHHRRPNARIGTPTIVSAGTIAGCLYLPAFLVTDWWQACALTLGFIIGYLAYTMVHHTLHHGGGRHRWLRSLGRRHGTHHQGRGIGRCYGVTSALWDRVFGTLDREAPSHVAAPAGSERAAAPTSMLGPWR